MNSSVSPRSYASSIAAAARLRTQPLGVDDRVVGELDPLPAAVAIHRVVATGHRADAARLPQPALDLGDVSEPSVGGVSRPSVNACRTRSGTPSRAASSMQASMCSHPECTPPSETSPIRCSRPRGPDRARSQAARSASFSKKLPSEIASLIRIRSCLTTAPAPRLRWPTSELPIWPSGQPDGGPGRRRAACAGSAPRCASKTGVSAWLIALPGPGGARPQPSRTTRQADPASAASPPRGVTAARRRRSRRTPADRGSRRRPGRRRSRRGPAARRRCRA